MWASYVAMWIGLGLLGINVAGLLESLEEPSDHVDIEHIGYSPVKEVMDWFRACKDGD